MRKATIIALCLALSTSGATVAATVDWIEEGVFIVQDHPVVCLTKTEKSQASTGAFETSKQDMLVTCELNIYNGHARSAWWHIRGAAIVLIYRSLWSPETRSAIFLRMSSNMAECPPRVRQG